MFRLLSKESNIFSVPIYIGVLFLIFISLNLLDFKNIDYISTGITFVGISLGYFLFNKTALNHFSHLPLFLYTSFGFFGIKSGMFPNSNINPSQ